MVLCALLLFVSAAPYAGHAAGEEQNVTDALQSNDPATEIGDNQDSVGDPIPLPGEEPPSMWMLLLQVIFSLGLVILLIFLLVRFLANRQLGGLNQSGPLKMVGTLSVGNGKTVNLVMIGESLYVLGVGQDVHLLRHIAPGDELDVILSEAEMKTTVGNKFGEWLSQLRGQRREEDARFQQDAEGSFEELLRKQWAEVNHPTRQGEQWLEDVEQSRGEKS
ncbi:flagellar biosynthetic protein FliO [Brevibacillus humidisoli]|uniref:flagellar biosynthetic protein FliO n=1 Tax=Brevibacillus humidisoli TaxID=2895522 RepID=UPI001E343790|nr:flagellar biosynthetic protein FliO [Brevibacillus humidisoli]UFJ42138.1 flagellar biosynthetic protein FliO [Brevibacillus humidisoli]